MSAKPDAAPVSLRELGLLSADLLEAETRASVLRARVYRMVGELYDAGVRPSLIADAAGVSRQRVAQIRRVASS